MHVPTLFRVQVLVDDEVVADAIATEILCRHYIAGHPDEPTKHTLILRAEVLDAPTGTVSEQTPIPVEELD